MTRGLIHLYHGDGKGKTTAAMGLALRAAGSGMTVCIAQFLKAGTSSELGILRTIPTIIVLECSPIVRFSSSMTDEQRTATRMYANRILDVAMHTPCDLLVLDEAINAHRLDLIDRKALEDFVRNKPEELELVLTGRGPAPFFLQIADYSTEMVCDKHPYQQGIIARKGIEY